jgi:hypothetical protein
MTTSLRSTGQDGSRTAAIGLRSSLGFGRVNSDGTPRSLHRAGCTVPADAAREPVVVSDSAALGGTLPGVLPRTPVALRTMRSQTHRVSRTASTSSRSRNAIRPSRIPRGRPATTRDEKPGTYSLTLKGF